MSHIKHTIAVLAAILMIMNSIPLISAAESAEDTEGPKTEAAAEEQAESAVVDEEGNGGTDGNGTDASEQDGAAEENAAGEESDVQEPEETDETDPSAGAEEEEKPDTAEEQKESREEETMSAMTISSGDTISYTSKHVASGSYGLEVVVISVTKDGTKYEGTCSQIGVKASSSGKATATKVSNSSRHAKIIYKYGIQKGWWGGAEGEESAKDVLGLSGTIKTTKRVLLEHMNQICVQGSDWKSEAVNNGGMTDAFADVVYAYTKDLDVSSVTVPSTFKLYTCDAGSDQDFTIWVYESGDISSTSAADKASKSQNIMADKSGVIVDTVRYKNVEPDKKYTITGTVYDKTAGKMLGAFASKNFEPSSESGSISLEIKTDTSNLKGHTLVVYEELSVNGMTVSTHEDAGDKAQTIYVPDIGTSASDVKTGEKLSNCSEDMQIRDTVTYRNLIPGKTYRITGTLMDKETGEALMDGDVPVTAEKEFTPASANGTEDIIFRFNGIELGGKTVVAFEECSIDGTAVAVHADINDEEQSVLIPALGTEASLSDDDTITDIVSYSNLIPGRTYAVRGYLNYKDDGNMVPDSDGETVFTADSESGSIEVELYPGDAYGDLVAFESLYIFPETEGEPVEGSEKLVAEHMDLECASQTVHIDEPPEEPVPPGLPPGRVPPATSDNTMLLGWMAFMAGTSLTLLLLIMKRMRRVFR